MFWLLITILFSFNLIELEFFPESPPHFFPLPQSWLVIENGLPLYLWPRKAVFEVNVIYYW